MRKLIDLDMAINAVVKESQVDGAYGYMDTKSIIDLLNDLPYAQPEIIPCKDCKYCTEHYDTDGNVPYWTCSEWDSGTDADGFCYMAERRTDERKAYIRKAAEKETTDS